MALAYIKRSPSKISARRFHPHFQIRSQSFETLNNFPTFTHLLCAPAGLYPPVLYQDITQSLPKSAFLSPLLFGKDRCSHTESIDRFWRWLFTSKRAEEISKTHLPFLTHRGEKKHVYKLKFKCVISMTGMLLGILLERISVGSCSQDSVHYSLLLALADKTFSRHGMQCREYTFDQNEILSFVLKSNT